jgi:hypothetical protein
MRCHYLSSRNTKITDHAPQINNGSHLTERCRYLSRQFVFIEVERDQIFQISECIGYRSPECIVKHARNGNKRTISSTIRTSFVCQWMPQSLKSHLAPRSLVIPPIADGILPRNCNKQKHVYSVRCHWFSHNHEWGNSSLPHTPNNHSPCYRWRKSCKDWQACRLLRGSRWFAENVWKLGIHTWDFLALHCKVYDVSQHVLYIVLLTRRNCYRGWTNLPIITARSFGCVEFSFQVESEGGGFTKKK